MTIYENVKTRADAAGMTISALEMEAKVSNGTIGGWRTSRPYAETLQKVARVLKCRVEDLLSDPEQPEQVTP